MTCGATGGPSRATQRRRVGRASGDVSGGWVDSLHTPLSPESQVPTASPSSSTSSSSHIGQCRSPSVLKCIRDISCPLPYRNIKTVLSVGGGSYSHSGAFNFITDSSKRSTFVKSAVKLVEDYGLDGIDIDFEFPDTDAKGSGLASLVTELRTSFDSLQKSKGDATPYLVIVRASPPRLTWQLHEPDDVFPGCHQRCDEPIQTHGLLEDGSCARHLEPDGASLLPPGFGNHMLTGTS